MSFALKKDDSNYIGKTGVVKKKKRIRRKREAVELPEFIIAYEEYLSMLNYSTNTIRPLLGRTKLFRNYFNEVNNIELNLLNDFRVLKIRDIVMYENYLIDRIRKKRLKMKRHIAALKTSGYFYNF